MASPKRLSLSRKRKRNEEDQATPKKRPMLTYDKPEKKETLNQLERDRLTDPVTIVLGEKEGKGEDPLIKTITTSSDIMSSVSVSPSTSDYKLVASPHFKTLLLSTPKRSVRNQLPLADPMQRKLDGFFDSSKDGGLNHQKTNYEPVHKLISDSITCERMSSSFVPQSVVPFSKPHCSRRFTAKRTMGSYSNRCPSYKWIPDTRITVDAFSYGTIENCSAYFLSHFHSDHYTGLNRRFTCPIYCSKITANLICQELKVNQGIVHSLPLEVTQLIHDVQATHFVAVVVAKETSFSSCSCPGSVMMLFKLPTGRTVLHTGDFRANAVMFSHTLLRATPINSLFLDTTYCSSQYNFPPQNEVVSFVVHTTLEQMSKRPDTLVVCGAYTIGKEKIFTGGLFECLSCICSNHPFPLSNVLNLSLVRGHSLLLVTGARTDNSLSQLPLTKLLMDLLYLR